jgi:hypothetical protein
MRYEKSKQPQENRRWMKSLPLMLTGGVVVVSMLVGFEVSKTGDRFFKGLSDFFANRQPEPKVDIQSIIIQQVRNASELTTAVFTMQAVVPTSQDATMNGLVIGTTRLLYIAQGEVQAGVDLSQLSPQNVQVNDDSIRIQLPPPRILNSKIDVNRSSVYDYNRGFLNLGPDVAPNLQSLAQQEALKKVVQTACTSGVLQQASDRANLVVTQLLNSAGYQTVIVESQPVSQEQCLGNGEIHADSFKM